MPGGLNATPAVCRVNLRDDYTMGAHPEVLASLCTSHNEITHGPYGDDLSCKQVTLALEVVLKRRDISVFFVPNGTSANAIIIATCLRPFEAVIAASSAHIVVREAGAIEATGHKIISAPACHGKLTPLAVEQALVDNQQFPHMSRPRLVYISNATELGTVYSRSELEALRTCCKQRGLILFMDGARLGTGLASVHSDLTFAEIADLVDVFWIGGTKNGALFGEAIVVKDTMLAQQLTWMIKRQGCLLANSWAIGAQFLTLFREDLYFRIADHANCMATLLSQQITEAGHILPTQAETNQVFAILPRTLVTLLQTVFDFYVWDSMQDSSVERQSDHIEDGITVRFVTSWATESRHIEQFGLILLKHRQHIACGDAIYDSSPIR